MKTTKKSFALGYSFVVHSFISYMFLAFVFVTFGNVVFPGFVAKFGWDTNLLSTLNTVGAVVASVAAVFIGQWVDKKGAKQVLVIGYLIGGINMVLIPFASSIAMLCVHLIISHITVQMYAQMTTNNLIAHWFAKKKGAILGVTTAGLPLGNAAFMALYTAVSTAAGMSGALGLMGGMLIVMGIVSIFWVKNTPYEVGLTPDNMPVPEGGLVIPPQKSYTFGQLLKNKTVWLLIVVFGLMFCTTIASVAQIVPFFMQNGFQMPQILAIMGGAAIGGVIGSVLFGFIDQKWGTKVATLVYCILAAVCYAGMFFISNMGFLMVAAFVAFGLNGAPGNLLPSYIISLFGPMSFNSVSKSVMPVVGLLRALGYIVAAAFAVIFAGGMAKGIYMGLTIFMVICFVCTIFLKREKVEIK